MKLAKTFDEYIKEAIIRRISVNKEKAEFLIKEAEIHLMNL